MNTTMGVVLSIIFALAIIIVIADAARLWIGIIPGKKEPVMREAPYEPSTLQVDRPGTVTAMSPTRDA